MLPEVVRGVSGIIDDIESDGRIVSSNKDPSGQKCVYINPGW